MPNWGLKVNIVKTLDTKKIQEFAKKANVNIQVGFKSGEQHNLSPKRKKRNEKYKGYNGEDLQDMQPIDVADLARDLHYGTATIPARPFLEDGIRSKEKEISAAMQQEAKKAINGGQASWAKVGTAAVGAIRELISSDYYKTRVPNSQKTIDYKGSDMPLIDTGQLKEAITFRVQGAGK